MPSDQPDQRPRQEIAKEAAKETNREKLAILIQELNRALSVQITYEPQQEEKKSA